MIPRRVFLGTLTLAFLAAPLAAAEQQARVHRIGVVHQGSAYSAAVEGLREGLKELGFEEGKQVVLDVGDTRGDLKAVEAAGEERKRAAPRPSPESGYTDDSAALVVLRSREPWSVSFQLGGWM